MGYFSYHDLQAQYLADVFGPGLSSQWWRALNERRCDGLDFDSHRGVAVKDLDNFSLAAVDVDDRLVANGVLPVA